MKFKTSILVVVASLVLASAGALADGVMTPHHGGKMVETKAGPRLELVVGSGTVDVYLTDHGGKASAAEGMSGKATLLVGGKKVEVALAPAGGNKLSGTGAVEPGAAANAIVTVEGGGQKLVGNFAK